MSEKHHKFLAHQEFIFYLQQEYYETEFLYILTFLPYQ
jgi:hypothetical protein